MLTPAAIVEKLFSFVNDADGAMIFSIMTFSITTLSIKGSYVPLNISDTQ